MTTLLLVLIGAIGLAFGSFGNVLVYRIHTGKNLSGRSMCPSCNRTLAWFELFPVISYIILRARCRTCDRHISLQYPLVECASSAIFVGAFLLYGAAPLDAAITAFILYFLFLTCVFDAAYQKIPDIFTIIIGVLAVALILVHGSFVSPVLGALSMLVWFGGQWLLSNGRAVGTGDIFLAAVLGLWLGLRGALTMLFFSYVVGALTLIVLILLGRLSVKQKRIAFVPFLGAGVLLTVLGAGDSYLALVGL